MISINININSLASLGFQNSSSMHNKNKRSVSDANSTRDRGTQGSGCKLTAADAAVHLSQGTGIVGAASSRLSALP